MKRKLLLASMILFFGMDAFSQATNWDDQNRYWYYRYRLVSDFLVRGEENPLDCNSATGYSLPAGNTFTGNHVIGVDGVDIEWGDATSYLGWYIGVLATEYRLLADNNQPTDATKQELYYAMKAYERLDRKEERLFYPHSQAADCSVNYLNGIFVRDDVNRAFLQTHPKLVERYSADGSFTMDSDYDKHNGPGGTPSTPDDNIYPAQDQFTDLFMGFALVKKCLGNNTYQGYNFRQKAIDYTYIIVDRLVQNMWYGRLIDGSPYKNGNLIVEITPYGIAKAATWITEQSHTQNLDGLAKTRWDALGDPVLGRVAMDEQYFTKLKDYLTALELTLAAIGSSWEYGLEPVRSDIRDPIFGVLIGYRYTYELLLPGMPVLYPIPPIVLHTWDPAPPTVTTNVTAEMLSFYGRRYDQEFYALLHEYLNNDGSDISSELIAGFIQGGPCEGPFNNPADAVLSQASYGWRGYNRWERPLNADGYIDIDHKPSVGRFNGLDYMLLYNIYRLTRGGGDVSYKNLLNAVSSNNLTSAGKYWSYETLELSGTVTNNASTSSGVVEISANNNIILKPGFKIEPGAKTRIYTGNYTACNTSIGNDASLRKSVATTDVQTNEQIEQQVFTGLAAKIEAKLDSISAVYSQYSLDSATLVSQYREENNMTEKCAVYPNPANSTFYVQLNLQKDQNVQILISDIYGVERKTLFDGPLNSGVNRLSFNIKDLQPGILNVEIKCMEINSVKRLVKKDDK